MMDLLETLTSQEKLREFYDWYEAQRQKVITSQRSTINPDSSFYATYLSSWELGHPYSGATGGDLTYMITPTSIGVILKVQYAHTKEIFDLTDYEWF